jgi:hypothetical protein
MAANLFIAGRVTWRAELKQTKSGSAMRSVLIAADDDTMPACRALVFGDVAEHVQVGDYLSVEGAPEISTFEKNGEIRPALSMMAKWSRLSGHGGARQRRSEAATRGRDDRHGDGRGAGPPAGHPAFEEVPTITETPMPRTRLIPAWLAAVRPQVQARPALRA